MIPAEDQSRRKWKPGRLGALVYILTLEMMFEMRRVGGFMSWMTDVALNASSGVKSKKGKILDLFAWLGVEEGCRPRPRILAE